MAEKFSKELKEAICNDRDAGISAGEVADKHGLTVQQVHNIYSTYRKRVETPETPTAPPPKPSTAVDWCAALEELKLWAKTIVGTDVTITGVRADNAQRDAQIKMVTASGQKLTLGLWEDNDDSK